MNTPSQPDPLKIGKTRSQPVETRKPMTAFDTACELPATVEQVFTPISGPDHLSRWWWPAGFTRAFTVCLLVSMTVGVTRAAETYAVFKSSDLGRSWCRSDAGLPKDSRINAFGRLPHAVFAGTDSGIFISKDAAESWQPVKGVAISSGRILCFATLGQKVFAGTDGQGMLMSSDKGEEWVRIGTFPSKKVRCLLAHGGRLYAGADQGGVFASGDGEKVWAPLQQGFPAHAQVFALAVVEGTFVLASTDIAGGDRSGVVPQAKP